MDDPAEWRPITSSGFNPKQAGEDRFAIYVWRSEREGIALSAGTTARPRLAIKTLSTTGHDYPPWRMPTGAPRP
jgi:hypothetical protein